jgi:hypothetical protein
VIDMFARHAKAPLTLRELDVCIGPAYCTIETYVDGEVSMNIRLKPTQIRIARVNPSVFKPRGDLPTGASSALSSTAASHRALMTIRAAMRGAVCAPRLASISSPF